jgi:hypothetical protein
MAPPRGTPVQTGLSNLASLHEQPGFRLTPTLVIDTVRDALDQAEARLRRAVEKAERSEEWPTFCRRGHLIARTRASAARFCPDCGAAALEGCPGCGAPIKVADSSAPPSFCTSCGAAFPWVDRAGRIHELENLLEREGLDAADELAVREQLDALADPGLDEDEQAERWQRVRRLAPGLMQSGRTILEGLASAYVRQQVGL